MTYSQIDIERERRPHRLAIVLSGLLLAGAAVHAQPATTAAAPLVLSLDRALAYALEHYPTVRVALEQLNASTESVAAARAAYLPRLDALWQINRATANNIFGQMLPQAVIPSLSGPALPSTSSQSVWGSAVGALVSWEPLDLGLRGATIEEAEAGARRARAGQELTRLEVQHAVGRAFLDVVIADRAVRAADADATRRDVLARAARTLVDNQLRPGAEASRAEAELAAARTRVIQARQAQVIATVVLAQVLGLADGAVMTDSARLLEPPAPASSGAPPAVHPMVQVGEAAVDLARAREGVLERINRPRLLLQSSVFARGSGANPDGPFEGGGSGLWFERANWAAGVQVVVPNLFEFASLRAQRSAAAAVTRAEEARRDEMVLTVTAEQRAADAQVDAARAIVQNTPLQVEAARLSEQQARARYEAGLASIVEVAEAQNLLAGAEYLDEVASVDVWRALLAQAVARGDVSAFRALVRSAGGS